MYEYWANNGKPVLGERIYGGACMCVSGDLMAKLEPGFDACLLTVRGVYSLPASCIKHKGGGW